ncbi:30 kDa heat shock protein [Madurella mycetomatis]|uniref:30 kDa heat shock protein n=1 Tax=Madurella mycetomatis TaxID=100816 RepID=A0A175VV99_9PEZI|nr:30 kDa heat shock protein [Madurella mycetomatis]
MMPFFSHPYCAPAVHAKPSLITLFRLLDDFDSYSREVQVPQQQQRRADATRNATPRRAVTTFKPRFDIRETETAYELQGELPGIERDNLTIEFTDPQTLVVGGHVERTYESKPETSAEAAASTGTGATETETAAAPATDDADETASTTSSHGWHHATVEDDPEDPSTSHSATPVETPETGVAKPAPAPVVAALKPEAPVSASQNDRFWLYERSVGEFSRSFSFPSRVEHEGVTASLQNGVLSITVPKAKKHQPRRITVF